MGFVLGIAGSAFRFAWPLLSPFSTLRNGAIAAAVIALLGSQVWLYQQGKNSGARKTIDVINKGIAKNHENSKAAQNRVGNLPDSDIDKRLQRWSRD